MDSILQIAQFAPPADAAADEAHDQRVGARRYGRATSSADARCPR